MGKDKLLIIAKRPSGKRGSQGRGEYELSGESGGHKATDLCGKRFKIYLNGKEYPTYVMLTKQGNKARFRLEEKQKGRHMANLIADLLFLPSPCRSESKAGHSLPILQDHAYVLDIHCRLKSVVKNIAVLEPVRLTARSFGPNGDVHSMDIDVQSRIADLVEVLEHLEMDLLGDVIGSQLVLYKNAFETREDLGLYDTCHEAIASVMETLVDVDDHYLSNTDPLPFLRVLLGLDELAHIVDIPNPIDLDLVRRGSEQDKQLYPRARCYHMCRVKEGRGTSAAKFKEAVMRAYGRRCLVCGLELPKVEDGSSGIEAAHILPWAKYDLDEVTNGIALCRNHHWAFDNGILTFECVDAANGRYKLIKGARYNLFKTKVQPSNEIVSMLESGDGQLIEDSLLPVNKSLRPSPRYLQELNEFWASQCS